MDAAGVNVEGMMRVPSLPIKGRSAKNSGCLYRWVIDFCSGFLSYLSTTALRMWGCVVIFFLSLSSFVVGSMEEAQYATNVRHEVGRPLLTPQLCGNGAGPSSPPSYLKLQMPSSSVRKAVTMATVDAVRKECTYRPTNMDPGLRPSSVRSIVSRARLDQCNKAIFYSPKSLPRGSNRSAFLPEGAVFALPATVNYDGRWRRWSSSAGKPFVALHAVAINFQPARRGGDPGEQEIVSYLRTMRDVVGSMAEATSLAIVDNVMLPGCISGGRHIVLPAFGAGAFLRSVKNLAIRKRLVDNLAGMMARAYQRFGAPKNVAIHLCLAGPSGSTEASQNHRAFKDAFHRVSGPNLRVFLEEDVDGSALAQDLANGGNAVVLIIAGNNNQLGNHWFDPGTAMRAAEENIYRRSAELAIGAFLFNGGKYSRITLRDYSQSLNARHVQLYSDY